MGRALIPIWILIVASAAAGQCPFEKMTGVEVLPESGLDEFGYAVAIGPERIAVAWPDGGGPGYECDPE